MTFSLATRKQNPIDAAGVGKKRNEPSENAENAFCMGQIFVIGYALYAVAPPADFFWTVNAPMHLCGDLRYGLVLGLVSHGEVRHH